MNFYLFCIGCSIGSFLALCIERIPKKISVIYPPSYCDICKHPLSFIDMIPLFSRIFNHGRCRYCHHSYPIFSTLVELGYGILLLFLYQYPNFITHALFSAICIVASLIDIKTLEIPDCCSFLIFILACITQTSWQSFLSGMFIISLPLFLVTLFNQSIGMGDIKLVAAGGALLGPDTVTVAFMLAIWSASIYAFYLLFQKKSRKTRIPMAPFLSISMLISSLFATNLKALYFSLFI